jgi:hypothetical protein
MMAPLQSHPRVKARLAAVLLAVLLLSACRGRNAAPATQTQAPATATEGEAEVVTEPTDTPPPTEDNSILFQDDFSDDDSGWLVVQAEHGLASYQNPELFRLEVTAPQTLLAATRPGAFSDFSLETLVTGSGGAGGQFRYGVVFRQITPDNYYAALVNPATQGYLIAKRLLGEWSTLAEGQNAAIPPNADAVTLRIDAQGPNLTFSINGTGLVTLVDTTFAAGDIGYVVEALDASGARLDADSIVIRRFNADTVPSAPTGVPVVATATETPSVTATPTPPVATTRPLASQAVPATPNVQSTLPALGTAIAATAAAMASQAAAALTQACSALPCP